MTALRLVLSLALVTSATVANGEQSAECAHATQVLASLVTADQAVRKAMVEAESERSRREILRQLATTDAANSRRAKALLYSCGWPTEAGASKDMWLIAQHTTDDEFQQSALVALREAVARGRASGRNLAYLEDRVALRAGGKQIYGTQLTQVGCELRLLPVDDLAKVEERRVALGLETVTAYLARASAGLLGPECRK